MAGMTPLGHILRGNFSTCVQRIDYPIHRGAPNPAHGKFYFVGSIPVECTHEGKSKHYDTEADAIASAIAAGAKRIQRVDCSFVDLNSKGGAQ
jgi:hypothetical protein